MKITITEAANEQIKSKLAAGEQLRLVYDADGCGCVNNGVPFLQASEELGPDDEKIETNIDPVHVEKRYKVFYDKEMTIDYKEAFSCFQLKSPNQMLNPRLRFVR